MIITAMVALVSKPQTSAFTDTVHPATILPHCLRMWNHSRDREDNNSSSSSSSNNNNNRRLLQLQSRPLQGKD